MTAAWASNSKLKEIKKQIKCGDIDVDVDAVREININSGIPIWWPLSPTFGLLLRFSVNCRFDFWPNWTRVRIYCDGSYLYNILMLLCRLILYIYLEVANMEDNRICATEDQYRTERSIWLFRRRKRNPRSRSRSDGWGVD